MILKKIPIFARVILLIAAFFAIAAAVMLFPNDSDFKGAEDIHSFEINGEVFTSREDIDSFVDWMDDTFGRADICFVKRNDIYMHEDSAWRVIVYRVPDKIEGIDTGSIFEYSAYRMYIYLEDGKLYYNGVEYEDFTLFEKG